MTGLGCGIGKMRHACLAREGFGECAPFSQQNSGCLTRKLTKIANQMGLIVVTTLDRDRCPCRIDTFYCAKDLLKSQDATEKLRTNTDLAQKAPFQLTAADARAGGELVY